MQVKGSAILPIKIFIQEKFKDEGYKKWLNNLDPEVKEIFTNNIMASNWYPIKTYYDGNNKIKDIFYNGDEDKFLECMEFLASYGINNFYKLFIKLGSPRFVIKRAGSIISTYFKPSKMEIVEVNANDTTISLTEFSIYNRVIELGIIGWAKVALELTGCKNVKTIVTKSKLNGDEFTEFHVAWE